MAYDYTKQVGVDSLLGVHQVHDISCPKINVLQFTPRNATRIYENDIRQDPNDLKVDLTELFKVMNDLDKWSDDMIKLLENLPEDLYNKVMGEVFTRESDYDKLKDAINTDHKPEIKEYADEINSLIEQWDGYRLELEEAKEEERKQQRLLEKEEKNVLFLKLKNENITDALEMVEFYKGEVEEQKEKQTDAIHHFERYIKDDFEKQINEFTNFLEVVRERNDDVRAAIGEIKYQIFGKGKDFLNLYQPDEYLDRLVGIKPKEANLGVIFNDHVVENRNELVNFNTFVIAARKKRFITFDQMNTLIMDLKGTFKESFREERKELLFEMLKENGFTIIRYYNDQKEYAQDRNQYKTIELNKPASKQKLKTM